MSIAEPVFGIDVHSEYQKGFDFDRAKAQGYEYAIVKASEGPEGHIGFCLGDGPDARFLQSHLETTCVVGEPGLNNTYTLKQSNTRAGGGNYYTH